MSDSETVTPGRPIDEVQKPSGPSQRLFDAMYANAPDMEKHARWRLPTEEAAEDVLSEFWLEVWQTIQLPGKFVDVGRTKNWLKVVLERRICDYYRKRSKIMELIAGSLDDETAANKMEVSFFKRHNDLTRQHSLRELLLATGEQCLTNEKHWMILQRDLDGEEEPPEGWTPQQVYDNRYRMLKKLEKAIKKVLGMA